MGFDKTPELKKACQSNLDNLKMDGMEWAFAFCLKRKKKGKTDGTYNHYTALKSVYYAHQESAIKKIMLIKDTMYILPFCNGTLVKFRSAECSLLNRSHNGSQEAYNQ